MYRWRIAAMFPLVLLLLIQPALAQESTPAAEEEAHPRAIPPSECQVEPRAVAKITLILQLDAEGIPMPPHSTITAPLGETVDPATNVSIREAARELLACFNAGDIPRAAALMTDHGVQRSYWQLTTDAAAREAAKARLAAPPQPRPPAAQIRFIATTDASVLPDGRMAAFVIITDPLVPPGQKTLLAYFTNQDGQWLVDDWVDFSIISAAVSEATPAA